MRAYFFGNMYMSSIQQGIQAAHTIADMFVKYSVPCPQNYEMLGHSERDMLEEWGRDHKTMILLSAGYSSTIRELVAFFDNIDNPYPWAPFHEGDDALDGALTDVGIILPEKVYETAGYLRTLRFDEKEAFLKKVSSAGSYLFAAGQAGAMEDTLRVFNKWEFDLILKLNDYGLAK